MNEKINEMWTKEEKKIQNLSQMYVTALKKLQIIEKNISMKKKISFIFVIMFIFTWTTLVICIYQFLGNTIFSNILSLIAIGLNVYVYIIFADNYIETDIKESDKLVQQIQNITLELDTLIEKYDIPEQEFYKQLNNKNIY